VKIGGFLPLSLCDFPGLISCVIFTQGCNFRCPFCHNSSLIATNAGSSQRIGETRVLEFADRHSGQLDGVVISGGEPTIQQDLWEVLSRIKMLGLKTMIETNGSSPAVLGSLIQDSLVDFMAMDVKAPMNAYQRLVGVEVDMKKIAESVELIAASGLPHEFRTTVVKPLLSDADMKAICRMIPAGSPHRLQVFRPEHALDQSLRIDAQ